MSWLNNQGLCDWDCTSGWADICFHHHEPGAFVPTGEWKATPTCLPAFTKVIFLVFPEWPVLSQCTPACLPEWVSEACRHLSGRCPRVRRWPLGPRRPAAAAARPAPWAEQTAWSETLGRSNSSRKLPPSHCQTQSQRRFVIICIIRHKISLSPISYYWLTTKTNMCLMYKWHQTKTRLSPSCCVVSSNCLDQRWANLA